jgi:hypothetical protein
MNFNNIFFLDQYLRLTKTEDIKEQGAETVWANEERSNKRMEKIRYDETRNDYQISLQR